jgi:uncharacterized membrane protein YbhN (UPF0104 family)
MAQSPESEAIVQKASTSWVRVAGSVISVLLVVWLMTRFGWQELLSSLKEIDSFTLLVSFSMIMISRFIVSFRWYFLCRSNKIKISVRNAVELTFAGLYASNFLPSTIGGDVVRYLGGIQLDDQKVKCAGSLIMDRLVGMLGMAFALPLGLVKVIPMLMEGKFDQTRINSTPLLALVLPAKLTALFQKMIKAFKQLLVQIRDWVSHPISLVMPLAMTFIHMLLLFGVISLIFNAMGEHVPFLMICGLYSVGYFITLIPISINGYGLQEISMTILFVTVAQVSTSHAVIMALVLRSFTMAASLPGSIFLPKIIPDHAFTRR